MDITQGSDIRGAATTASVLYVEDNAVNAVLMEAIIGMRAHTTLRVALDGTQAIHFALQERPDLLLLDMHLPDMDGFELLTALRRHASLRNVPAVAVSAATSPQDLASARAHGFIGYWTKPLELQRTLAELDQLLAAVLAPALAPASATTPHAPAAPTAPTELAPPAPKGRR